MGQCGTKLGVTAVPVHVFDASRDVGDDTGSTHNSNSNNSPKTQTTEVSSLSAGNLNLGIDTSQSFSYGQRGRLFSPHSMRNGSRSGHIKQSHSWYGRDMYVRKSSSWLFGRSKKNAMVPAPSVLMTRDDKMNMTRLIQKSFSSIQSVEADMKHRYSAIIKRHKQDVAYLRELVANLHHRLCLVENGNGNRRDGAQVVS